ncbi:cyclic nucleotide-binding domain-containing protein, partial [Gemmatimonas aurantiaca]|nr:cyclic nucleotide-binding domain-containing protein [Gemmatimonas aurantiaca]
VFEEGEPGSTMLLILTGAVEIYKDSLGGGARMLIGRRGAGEFLGEMALVEELPRSATVVAQSSCEVLEFSMENFERIIQEQPALATRVLRSLSNKLRESDFHRISELEESNRILNATNEELVRLNAFLDCIIDRSPSAILLATRSGQIFRINSAAVRMFELSNNGENHVVDQLFGDFSLNKFRSSAVDSWHGQVTAIRNSENFPAYLSVASLTGHSDSILHLFICQDITELQAFNRAANEYEKYASARETASELAHDLKNMLGVLLGNVELVVGRLSDEQRIQSERAIEGIEQADKETRLYLENFMAYRKDSSEYESVNLRTMLKAIVRFCSTQGIFKNIELDFTVDTQFPKTIMIREGQIQSVIVNLLTNAAEALNERNETNYKAIQIDLSVDPSKSWAILKVLDNGPGISKDKIPKLFKESFTTKENGHGIGLVSVGRIVQSHGGEVSVESQTGLGATFIVKLPLQRSFDNA